MGVVRDKYPNALNTPLNNPVVRFGIGEIDPDDDMHDLNDDVYHVIDTFGTPWCETKGEIMIDEEPSELEYMCSDCIVLLDDEESMRIAVDL